MRPIDADALLTERKKRMYYHLPNGDIAIPLIDIINAPTVEAQPEQTGRWIPRCVDNRLMTSVFECSNCGVHTYTRILRHIDTMEYDYCPYCGAKMKGKTDD